MTENEMTFRAYEHENSPIIEKGRCGENAYYVLLENLSVYIYGSGRISNYGGHFVHFCVPSAEYADVATHNDFDNYIDSAHYDIDDVEWDEWRDEKQSPFKNNDSIKKAVIEQGITGIGKDAFKDCTRLSVIIFPDSLTNVGDSAFAGCFNLTSIILPEKMETISEFAFSGCTKLNNLILPNSLTRIGESAFSNCKKLTNVKLPDSLTTLSKSTFSGCTELKSVT